MTGKVFSPSGDQKLLRLKLFSLTIDAMSAFRERMTHIGVESYVSVWAWGIRPFWISW